MQFFYLGHDGERVVNSATTQKQIDAVRSLDSALVGATGDPIAWDELDDRDEPRTLFQFILQDRRRRVDEHVAMADRPPVAVVSAIGNRAVRVEMYEGHDALVKTEDLRALELQGRQLPDWMDRDPYAYDPVAFLERTLGLPSEFTGPLLAAAHGRKGDGDEGPA